MPNLTLQVRRLARVARRGFTLIELLAVIMIIGILSVFLIPRIPEAIESANKVSCEQNLKELYKGFMLYNNTFNDLPQQGGVRFFTALITRKTYPNTKGVIRRMTCPSVKPSALPSLVGLEPEEYYADPEAIDGGSSAYAGRDIKEHPLRKFPGPGKEPLVADDNDPEPNHDYETLVLYDDGNVVRWNSVVLVEKGVLAEDEDLLVGPDSQVEELRKLSLD